MSRRWNVDDLRTIEARNVCLLKPSAFGDVVQTLPLLGALRRRFPAARLSWVVNRSLVPLVAGHPDLDEAISFEPRAGWRWWWRFLNDFRRQRFDLVLDLQGLLRTGVVGWASLARTRVGLETAREGSRFAHHVVLPNTGRLVPAHERYWRVAEALGVGDAPRTTSVPATAEQRARAAAIVAGFDGPVLAIHAGARWVTKRWPVEKFAAVAAKASRRFGFGVVLVGSPDEADDSRQLEAVLRQLHPECRVRNVVGATNLNELAALLATVDVALTNDSGPMHLAAAVGTPVVGVFTCTSPVRSGPPGDAHELVATTVPCAASYKKRCPHSGNDHTRCFEELAVDRVWQAFERLVDRTASIRIAA